MSAVPRSGEQKDSRLAWFLKAHPSEVIEAYAEDGSLHEAIAQEVESLKAERDEEVAATQYTYRAGYDQGKAEALSAHHAIVSALQWIADQRDLMFAECSQAEEIIRRAKEALASLSSEEQRQVKEEQALTREDVSSHSGADQPPRRPSSEIVTGQGRTYDQRKA